MDKTLERQLKRLFGSLENVSPQCQGLISVVNQTYKDFQNEYKLIERALDISSVELNEVNQRLRHEIKIENQLTDKLKKETVIIEEIVQTRTKELIIERVKLEKIAQNMKTGAVLVNNQGEVIFLNGQARMFIHFFNDDYAGSLVKLYEVFPNYPIEEYVTRSLAGEILDLDDVQENDSIYQILFQPMFDDSNPAGSLVWIDNVTEEKQLERSKSELVVVASHQLRTPLTVTKGNTEILLDQSYGTLTAEQKIIIEQTHESNEKMITLVNQMLDIAKIEQKEFSFQLTDIQVATILEQVIKDLSSVAEEKNVQIEYKPNPDALPVIKGNSFRLYQVFQNLIDNAIKYSRSGDCQLKIIITTVVSDTSISITISDEGIGIPPSEQNKIFTRFYRASNAETSFIDGTGLGLHIVKSIIESSGGTINFVSEENKGTIFTIEFPIQ